MDNNNLNIKDLNNTQQPNMEVKQLKILEQPELTEQITTEEAQYRYLKELNKKLTLQISLAIKSYLFFLILFYNL